MTRRRLVLLLVATLTLVGCAAQPAHPAQPATLPADATAADAAAAASAAAGVAIVENVDFGGPAGIRLDVCLPSVPPVPANGAPLPAIISVHGGGWYQGDKAERPWRESCAWLASEGFVVFQTNYRLAPQHPFPAGIEDVAAAVDWIRSPVQAARFGYDPARLGAFGDSAGGNLVALLATHGQGDNTLGRRVAAVVELSAPVDLTAHGTTLGPLAVPFQNVQLSYLGCDSYADCAQAGAASPSTQVDATDPPFFVVHATEEFIPVEQADAFVGSLTGAGVSVTYHRVASDEHALDLLTTSLRGEIARWLHSRLGS